MNHTRFTQAVDKNAEARTDTRRDTRTEEESEKEKVELLVESCLNHVFLILVMRQNIKPCVFNTFHDKVIKNLMFFDILIKK